jgi:Nif-specific regulatory protein
MAAPLQLGTRPFGLIYVEDGARTDPFAPEDLHFLCALASLTAAVMNNAEQFRQTADAAEALKHATEEMIGESVPMRQLKMQMARYAPASNAHVLIRGESGTGKELVARTLHALSPRSDHAFVAVNCAAMPETMIESELFGYERGAFTGAIKNRRGKFLLAHCGTLFLDEIGDLSMTAQAKVLRAIEDGEIQPLGSERVTRADVRIISATHKDLTREVAEGRFREDLYYRLNALELQVEPLRARGEDILLLAQAFLERAGARMGRRFAGFTAGALQQLRAYSWPGNIRQLRNEIERAAILADSGVIGESDLGPRLTAPSSLERPDPTSLAEQFAELDSTERALVERALAKAEGNVSEAARVLGISRIMMKRRLERFGLASEQTQ